MKSLSLAAALLVALATPGAALAQTALFPRRAEIDIPVERGLVRAELPAEIVEACGPSLGDLRVYDNGGTHLPYVVDGAPPAGERVTTQFITPAEARQLTETPTGAAPRYHEEYDLDLPGAAPTGGSWSLVLATDDAHFTAEVRLERFGEDGAVELLTARTLFRLPSGSEQLEIALPADARGRIRVRISGEQGFLSPRFEVRSVVPPATPTFLSLDLPIESVEHVDGTTTLVVRRPLSLVPSAIALATSATTAQRYVRVVDAGADGTQAVVGAALVSRVAGRSEGPLLVALDGPRGDRLRIEIDDEDGEPLPDLRVEARIHQPSLVFDASSTYRPVWIYFGGARALPPSFPEASALLEAAHAGPPPELASIVRIEENPAHTSEPALSFAMHPGEVLEVGAYQYEAPLSVPESPEGLVRVVLPPAVDARVDPLRQDLRVVDSDDRQWPYLLGYEPAREEAALEVERTSPHARTSRYELALEDGPLEIRQLLLRVSVEYVDRPYQLLAPAIEPDGDERIVSTGRLRRRPGDGDVLRIDLRERVDRLFLEVQDGDDAPLAIQPSAFVALPVLHVVAPAGTYSLLFGVPRSVEGVERPYYELENMRDLALTVRAVEARVGAVGANARFAPPSPYSSERMLDFALWALLGLAVLVLGAITFRLAKAVPEPPEAG